MKPAAANHFTKSPSTATAPGAISRLNGSSGGVAGNSPGFNPTTGAFVFGDEVASSGGIHYSWSDGGYEDANGNFVGWNYINANFVQPNLVSTYIVPSGMQVHIFLLYGQLQIIVSKGDPGQPILQSNGAYDFSNLNGKNGGATYLSLLSNDGSAGGGESNTLQTINATASIVSNTTAAISTTLTSTNLGSDIAYALSNSKILITGVKYLKPVGYGASVVSILTDVGLSINGQQSWTETGINTGVTVGAMIIGGWPGLIIQLDYIGAKTYMQTVNEHPEWILPASYHSFTH